MCTRTQKKGAVTPQETAPDSPVCVWEHLVEAWVSGGPCRVGDTDYSSTCLRSFKGGHHYLHYLQHSLKRKKVKVKLFSRVRLFATPWTVAQCASLPVGFSRQEHWSGLPSPPSGGLLDPGIEPWSLAFQADALTSEPPGKPQHSLATGKIAGKEHIPPINRKLC